MKDIMKERTQKNYQKTKEIRAQHYQENKEEIRRKMDEYYAKNPGKKQEINKKYFDKRYYNDNTFRISHAMSNQIRGSLKEGKNKTHWEELVDFTIDELIQHLEEQFDDNMNWDNYGIYWQIDHIVPVNAFEIESYEDDNLRKCWSLENLQPLENTTNTIKSDEISEKWGNVQLAKRLLGEE